MNEEITHDDVDRHFHLLRSDPEKFLELTNKLVGQHPLTRMRTSFATRHGRGLAA